MRPAHRWRSCCGRQSRGTGAGGRLSAQAKQIAQEAGVELVDYFAREELTIRNAIPTAEGCLGILLRQRKRTLWGSGVLVTGFGRWGRRWGRVWQRWGLT